MRCVGIERARLIMAVLACLLVTLAWTSAARADGKAFFVAKPPAEMPGQQALIHFENGVETLAIETRLVGEGSECAWVVPLPAKPEVSAATTGVFPSLRAMFQPSVKTYRPWTGPAVILVLLGLTFLYSGGWRGIAIACVLVILGFLMFVPTLGKVRGAGGPIAGVEVVDRQIAGSFEVVTLDASEGDSLLAWLSENGFGIAAADKPVIDAYIKEKWVFVASKLRHQPGKETTPHPLVFRFPAEQAVYPMRLTGTQSGSLDLELYVFGAGTASAEGMRVEASGPVDWDEVIHEHRPPIARDSIVVAHAGVKALAGRAKHGTKLVGTFTPGMMKRDIEIGWGEPAVVGRVAMARYDAIRRSVAAGLAVLGGGLIIAAVIMASFRGAGGPRSRKRACLMIAAMVLGAAAGSVVAATGPRTVEVRRWSPQRMQWFLVWDDVWERAEQAKKDGIAVTPDWVRAQVAEFVKSSEYGHKDEDDPRPDPIEQDSPGNYSVRTVGKRVYLAPVNDMGQEIGVGFDCEECGIEMTATTVDR